MTPPKTSSPATGRRMMRMPSRSSRSLSGRDAGMLRDNASNWRRSRLQSLLTPGRPLPVLSQTGRMAADHQDFVEMRAFIHS